MELLTASWIQSLVSHTASRTSPTMSSQPKYVPFFPRWSWIDQSYPSFHSLSHPPPTFETFSFVIMQNPDLHANLAGVSDPLLLRRISTCSVSVHGRIARTLAVYPITSMDSTSPTQLLPPTPTEMEPVAAAET